MKELPLRAGVFGAEPWTDAMRQHIEKMSGIEAFDIYGLSEIIGPGVGCECRRHQGLHIFEDHFYPEIVDPETGAPLPDGERGRTGADHAEQAGHAHDPLPHARHHQDSAGPCACGRTLRRIGRIGRRSDDMLIIRGVNVFPSQVETALLAVDGALPHYQIILTREQGLDQMEVQVEVTPQMFNDKIGALQELHDKLQGALDRVLGIRVRCAGRGAYHRAQRGQGKTGHRQADIMKIQQISLFVENKPGHIAAPRACWRGGHRYSRPVSGGYAAVRHSAHDRRRLAEGRRILEAHGFVVK
jgi:phenylacetate-coenzyme A ligase PaaK-like adenylate-forming protein